jgi:hypothetical protein
MRRLTAFSSGHLERAHAQIVEHRHGVPQLPPLRHPGDAEPVDLVWPQAQQVMFAVKADGSALSLKQAHDCLDDGGLAGAVRT